MEFGRKCLILKELRQFGGPQGKILVIFGVFGQVEVEGGGPESAGCAGGVEEGEGEEVRGWGDEFFEGSAVDVEVVGGEDDEDSADGAEVGAFLATSGVELGHG